MAQGNPNPSPATRFKPGNPGNPGGKTAAQKKREIANAERATRIRARMLAALERNLDDALAADDTDSRAIEIIGADILRLLKDSEDRGFGAPSLPIGGADDLPPIRSQTLDPKRLSAETMRELLAARDEAPEPEPS